MINGGWYERYLSIWITRPWLLPCFKVIYFTAYSFGIVFIYFCNIVKLILRTPLKSLWLFLGLIVGPFMYCFNELCVLDLMMCNMWLWSINFYPFFILLLQQYCSVFTEDNGILPECPHSAPINTSCDITIDNLDNIKALRQMKVEFCRK